VRYLVDTHVLLWQSDDSPMLTTSARATLSDATNQLFFSVVSLWELVIKSGKGGTDLRVDVAELRIGLMGFGYDELTVTAEHVLEVERLDRLHNDPFDRLLLAQARVERLSLLTADRALLAYGPPTQSV
jgi:PIN domain nuclease of toxin-antitoxin system